MSEKMLIDAAHQGEVRVAIVKNGVLEELDYQSNKKQSTKGNIYLAKVTRVEPSLQAAFVDYGGNRHGFLPFAEIHPDYYQIPVADREKLLEEIRSLASGSDSPSRGAIEQVEEEATAGEGDDSERDEEEEITSLNQVVIDSAEDGAYEKPEFYKRYKIQEVIKRDQVILVQIEKEERGTKGAALTTYISIAGRYCVFMPNATKRGGVSRKIADASDRERLRKLSKELTDESQNPGAIIIRTAGAFKPKAEIKRDCVYLQKLWDNIRAHTLKSIAPTFIHEEGDVIKKAIRDLYNNDINEIVVQGDVAFNDAKAFMQMILPKHISKVQKHTEHVAIFSKYGIEQQVAQLYSNHVHLKSGGYMVINQTEALVSIDVNSGRSTSERNVENTAFRTNLEAAREAARQLRLRDLSGLVVIDFIDMEDNKNKRAVEKALKEALAVDKAKIQMSKISHFGLLEMSRQRIKQSFVESNTQVCEHCQGRGRTRRLGASALAVLRAIESEIDGGAGEIAVSACSGLISYLLNDKRPALAELDKRFNGRILFEVDEKAGGDGFFIEKKRLNVGGSAKEALSKIDDKSIEAVEVVETEAEDDAADMVMQPVPSGGGRRKRRRNKNGGKKDGGARMYPSEAAVVDAEPEESVPQPQSNESQSAELQQGMGGGRKGKRKWKKGGGGGKPNHSGGQPNHSGQPGGVRHDDKHKAPGEEREVAAERAFDNEMAERRRANQSLLKEIWKKIVDQGGFSG